MNTPNFLQSYQAQQTDLLDFAYYLTRDRTLAEDLMQETVYKAFKYRTQYEPDTNWKAWLMTIMRNTFINDYRKQKRRQGLSPDVEQSNWVSGGNRADLNQGESNVSMKEILEEVSSLDDWMRVPFIMQYQGYKYEEISQALDLPLGTVKSRIFFARKKLKSALAKLYPREVLEDMMG